MAGEIDVTNTFGVVVRGKGVLVRQWGLFLSTKDAYKLAAYLVATAEGIDGERLTDDPLAEYHAFDEWLNAVRHA